MLYGRRKQKQNIQFQVNVWCLHFQNIFLLLILPKIHSNMLFRLPRILNLGRREPQRNIYLKDLNSTSKPTPFSWKFSFKFCAWSQEFQENELLIYNWGPKIIMQHCCQLLKTLRNLILKYQETPHLFQKDPFCTNLLRFVVRLDMPNFLQVHNEHLCLG